MAGIDYQRIVLAAFLAIFGIASLLHSIFGKVYHFAVLGSEKPGLPMPKWLARPFFFLMGVGFLWCAFQIWVS